jgi:galactose-1-phosphate uridylyltransferase
MDFQREVKKARFLDPFNQFNEGGRECEIRKDPLTGRKTRILFFPVKEIPAPDIEALVEKTKGFCPFCPEYIEQITPKFLPELFPHERYRVGAAVCFPNAFPYDENGAVTVISERHYIPVSEFTEAILSDALMCCINYLADVVKKQPVAAYQSINWNYMPLAGSSILHPHLQITASSSPTNYYDDLNASAALTAPGGNIFTLLIDSERAAGERFLGETDTMAWMLAFAPLGAFDVLGVFRRPCAPSNFREREIGELAAGIIKTLRFLGELNIHSFNMALYFNPADGAFHPHVRICPRVSIPPLDTSEINYMRMLHNETMTTMKPEEVAAKLRVSW